MSVRTNLLDGVKVLDLSRVFTGPFCTQVLADLGAEVVKVEPPKGDDTRRWGPPFVAEDLSTYFVTLNRNKRSIVLDLKTSKGLATLKKLIAWCDVFVENFRPGVCERLGLSPQQVWEVNPKVVYVSITGFGSKGPFRDRASYDIIAQSESGIMGITGSKSGEIAKVGVPIGDIAGALYAVIGVLVALRHAEKTGRGMLVETSLLASLASWLTYQAANAYVEGKDIGPMGTEHANIVPYQAFKCKDGKWLTIAIGNSKHWEDFCKAIGRDDLIENERFATNALRISNREELTSLLANVFSTKTRDEWEKELVSHRLPVGKVRTVLEVLEHPQLLSMDQLFFIDYPASSVRVPIFKLPVFFSEGEEKQWLPPPTLNRDEEWILDHVVGRENDQDS